MNKRISSNKTSFRFSKDQVRVLLFRDCERTGRKLLFDSSTIQRVANAQKPKNYSFERLCNGKRKKDPQLDRTNSESSVDTQEFKYQNLPPNADVNSLSEMMFGSVAMNFKGMSLKVHVLDSPERLMYTKVFPVSSHKRYRPHTISENCDVSSNTCYNQNSTKASSSSKIIKRSSTNFDNSNLSSSLGTSKCNTLSRDDSGLGGEVSSHSSLGSYSNFDSFSSIWDGEELSENFYYFGRVSNAPRPNSSSSIRWRLNRHFSTSFNCSSESSRKSCSEVSIPPGSDSQMRNNNTNESISGNSNSSRSSHIRRGKMGIALLITLTDKMESQMIRFLMEHALLIENALDRLRLTVQFPYSNPYMFISKMTMGTDETAQWLSDLLTAPRINVPLWIGLAGSQKTVTDLLADRFIQDFCYLLNNIDTKNTYFFMSTLITNVLTYHLGWVNSVSPYNTSLVMQQKELDSLGRNHPYNPLWAQLGELYGAIGAPARVSKTIIHSKENSNLIQRVITVLSYFIRCSEVKRTDVECKYPSWESLDILMDNQRTMNSPLQCQEVDGDYIEMSTFSSNHPTVDTRQNHCSTNLNEFSLKVDSNSDNVTQRTLKKTKSCSNQLQNINSEVINKKIFKESDSNLSSIKTLVPNCTVKGHSSNGWNFDHISIVVDHSVTNSTHNLSNGSNNKLPDDRAQNVVFVLGENETLIGLKEKLKEDNKEECSSSERISLVESHKDNGTSSLHPDSCCTHKSTCKHSNLKKHSREKFEFDKYPRIVTNYMKSKNLELLDRHVVGKPGNLKIDGLEVERNLNFGSDVDSERCSNCSQNVQILQTPSNASELEFVSDIPLTRVEYAQEIVVPSVKVESADEQNDAIVFIRRKLDKTLIINSTTVQLGNKLSNSNRTSTDLVEVPMPPLTYKENVTTEDSGYCHTLIGGVTDHYIADMVLQGMVTDVHKWETHIRRDLMLQSRTAPGGAACLLADVDDWSINVWGPGSSSGGMSTLIAAMLDTLMRMQRAKIPSRQCLIFIESKLREFCVRSKALAELLLKTDFCDMNYLTKTLNLDTNDVPLLMAIASTHSPEVISKYGISFK